MLKKTKLRYNEYYDMQRVYDSLYSASKNGNNFYKLLEIIGSEENIRLAYRNLKSNKGSNTKGTDGKTIDDIKELTDETVINTVREMLADYKPKSVRRVYIPKPGSDKKRPLGIPCIWDRLVQQCILQVLEPICEPKFHNHSYGFRPNRDTHHAISRTVSMINMYKHYYCVDVDIKGFFDNVDHGKLLKQIWTLGIRDKRLISIISKILKSEIKGEGIPTKGTPQGGIISPLLSLIVLNELDWWISNQWETFKPNRMSNVAAFRTYAKKYTNLKDGFLIRYADDFKIMCGSYNEAQRWYHATVAIKNYNSAIRGIQNYYCIATNIYNNLTDVNYALLPTIRIRLRDISKTIPFKETDINFQKQTMGIQKETKIVTIGDMCLLPLTGVHHRSPMNFSQEISNYTSKGREKIHKNLMLITQREFEAIAKMRDPTETIEFNDNSLSAYVIQQGNCYITGNKLDVSHMKCIRKKPLKKRGTNNHGNIIFINSDVYKAIFTRKMVEAQGLLRKFKLNEEQWKKVNYIRQNYDYQKV